MLRCPSAGSSAEASRRLTPRSCALYLFLLHAPAQILSALQILLTQSMRTEPDALEPILLTFLLSVGNFVLALAVFFIFPFLAGGILRQVRDRLVTPHEAPGPFAAYGRAHYGRLLGNLGLFTLATFVLVAPVMCLIAYEVFLVFQLGATEPAPSDAQVFARFLLTPVTAVALVILSLLLTAIAMVYWVANCTLVSSAAGVLASWRQALRFCRQNFAPCVAVWLLIVAVSTLIAPVGLASQLGWITHPWAVVATAVLYAAFIGYLGVLDAGLVMSLYVARQPPADQSALQEVEA